MALFAICVLGGLGLATALLLGTRSYLEHDARFRIGSAASIQTLGNSQLTRGDLLSVFGGDVGRSLFHVPLENRRVALEQIPWVERATVMRLWPNQLRVAITERVPVAFIQVHGRIELADANGVILTMTPQQMAARHYSFVVVDGINPDEPLSVRSARMHLYQRLVSELDATGEHISAELSEIDVSDPDDVRATVPANGSDLLLHFGDEDFLARWRNYKAHIGQWQAQFPHLVSVDLRYDREVVLKMTGETGADAGPRAATSSSAAPAAAAAAKPLPAAATTTALKMTPTAKADADPAKPRAGSASTKTSAATKHSTSAGTKPSPAVKPAGSAKPTATKPAVTKPAVSTKTATSSAHHAAAEHKTSHRTAVKHSPEKKRATTHTARGNA